MGWQGVRLFVHAPSRTLARVHGGTVQVLREGRELARVSGSSEVLDESALGDDGTLFMGPLGFVRLGDDHLTVQRWDGIPAAGKKTMHPAGRIAVVLTHAAAEDPNASEAVRRTHRRVPAGAFQLAFVNDDRSLDVVVEAPASLPDTGRDFTYGAQPLFASDGRHWAVLVNDPLLDAPWHDRRLILGRDDRVLAHHRLPSACDPETTTCDLDRGAIYLVGHDALVARSLEDGRVVCEARGQLGRVRSALVPDGDALLAAVATGTAEHYALVEHDPGTLVARGPRDGAPVLRDVDGRFALAALPGGGLAWAPTTQAVQLVDADASWCDGPLTVRANPAPPVIDLDHLHDLGAASPEERVALARLLLDRRARDPRFVALVRAYPEAFHPHLDDVLAWPDEHKRLLRELDWRRWSAIARGAPDSFVDALGRSLESAEHPTYDARGVELRLLAAVETPHALLRLGSLGRSNPEVAAWCAYDQCLEIPASGPAVRRYDPDERVLRVLEDPARAPEAEQLASGIDAAAWLAAARGIACLRPPTHLLRVPLDRLAGLQAAPLDAFHFALSECTVPACNEWAMFYEAHAMGRDRLALKRDLLEGDTFVEDAADCCPGKTELPTRKPYQVALTAFDPRDTKRALGRVGGRPDWTQDAEHPSCPRCERLMFFVGQIDSGALDVAFFDLFAFVCERCAVTVQIRQNT